MVSMIRLKRCKTVGRFIFIGLIFLIILSVLFGVNVIELGVNNSRETQDEATLGKILQRLENLENKVSQIYAIHDELALPAGSEHQKKDVSIKGRICVIPNDWRYPFCAAKVQWIKTLWQKNTECYIKEHHIIPTDDCTILQFLSEAEAWCPSLPGRERPDPLLSRRRATIRTDIEGLLKWFEDDKWLWMRDRATRLWPYWVEGAKALQKRKPEIEKRAAQRILMFMGTFSVEPRFFQYAYHGGPLGELVQWTDLICSLYILGHDLNVSANADDLKKLLNVPKIKDCASARRDDDYDQIFTDYNGHKLIVMAVGPNHSQYRCKVRILDSFGTDAEFNYAEYSEPIPGGRSPWANADVNLRQIFTMFPHSPDNSFLGFVVDSPVNVTIKLKKVLGKTKKPIGLVYGKEARFWKGHKDYIDTLSKYLEIHATTNGPSEDLKNLPDYVTNHGILKGGDLRKLLDQAKVFIGLGFPYEGPAPLEAIAHGAIFLNAKLDPPQDRLNTGFFKLKPTLRALTSQHPYAETFIGEPHVSTVDIKNISVVEKTIKRILRAKVKPYLPLEWTPEGMLERLSSFAEYMNFCTHKTWPPEDELQLILGDEGTSCKEACWKNGLLCESNFFNSLNSQDSFEKLSIECDTRDDRGSLVMPAYNTADKSCVLQNHPLLFSCVASKPKHARLCPCRDFQPQQVALCKKCT